MIALAQTGLLARFTLVYLVYLRGRCSQGQAGFGHQVGAVWSDGAGRGLQHPFAPHAVGGIDRYLGATAAGEPVEQLPSGFVPGLNREPIDGRNTVTRLETRARKRDV